MYEYAARLDKVVDGDTVDLDVQLGFDITIRQRIRLLGINCAEHGTIAGDDATAYTRAWFNEHGPDLIVRTVRDKKEKFGRILGTIVADTHILNNDLVTSGHAVDYTGGKRTLPTQQGEAERPAPVL